MASKLWHVFFLGLMRPITGGIILFLALTWVLQSTRFLDLILNKGLSFGVFLHLTGLLIPFLLQFILPFGFLLGICAFLKRLNDESELTPWFATGISPWQLAHPILAFTMLAVAFGYLITLLIMPLSMTAFKDMQHQLRNQDAHIFLEAGTFNQLGNGLMIYLKQRTGPYHMRGLLVHDSRRTDAPTTWMAKTGSIQISPQGTPQLNLYQGIRQDINTDQVTMLEFDKHTLELTFTLSQTQQRSQALEEFTLPELQTRIKMWQGKEQLEARAEWHKRLLWPLTPLVFMCIAIAALLQPVMRRRGVSQAIVWACLTALAYKILLIVSMNTAQSGASWLLLAQWALPIAFSLLSLWLLVWSMRRT